MSLVGTERGVKVTCIHWHDLVVAEEFGHKAGVLPEDVRVESSGGVVQNLRLFLKGFYDFGVAVAVVVGRVAAEVVVVAFTFDIPHEYT